MSLAELISQHPFLEKPIIISGTGRSGTTLLSQLLDSHPDLLVWPFEFPLYACLNIAEASNQHSLTTVRDYHEVMMARNKQSFDHFGQHFDGHLVNYSLESIDVEKFFALINEYIDEPVTRKQYIQLLNLAFYQAQSSIKEPTYFVMKTNEFFLQHMSHDFPDFTFINMLRDPVETYLSQKKYYASMSAKHPLLSYYTKDPFLPARQAQLESVFRFDSCLLLRHAVRNMASIRCKTIYKDAPNYVHLSLEELQRDSQEVIEKLTDFLKIPFHESLLSPTVLGQKAVANMTSQKVTGEVVANQNYVKKDLHASFYELYWLKSLLALDQNKKPSKLPWYKKWFQLLKPMPYEFQISTKEDPISFPKYLLFWAFAFFMYSKNRVAFLWFSKPHRLEWYLRKYFPVGVENPFKAG